LVVADTSTVQALFPRAHGEEEETRKSSVGLGVSSVSVQCLRFTYYIPSYQIQFDIGLEYEFWNVRQSFTEVPA
jgi:hypothetical protein